MINKIENPVFLVGSERSGTTLLRLMLDSHPNIAFNLESEFMVKMMPDHTGLPDIHDYHKFLLTDRVFSHSRFSIDKTMSYPELMNSFLKQKKYRDKKQFVGATIHYQFAKLLRIWPNAKFIYMYRDGRDVANSIVNMGWAGNTYVASDWWIRAETEWNDFKDKINQNNKIEIKYEDLITSPDKVLERICIFFGTTFSKKMYDYIYNSSYEYPNPKLAYQWIQKSDPKGIRLCESKIGVHLKSRGYIESGHPIKRVGIIENRLLYIDSKLKTIVYRIKYFGLGLIMRNYFAKKLRLTNMEKKTVKIMNQIVDERLT